MAKKNFFSKDEKVNDESGARFMDKTNMSWYSKIGTNKVTFCSSIDDIMEGKGETYTFTSNLISFKMLNRKDKEVESKKFILFVLDDGNFALANKWNAL